MKNDIVQSAQSAFAITFTSANPNEYPVIYAEDQWHTANKSDKICTLYDKTHSGSTTSATGAQFTQREINETLANTVDASNSSITKLNQTVNTLNSKVSSLESGIVNVYRFKGSVNSLTELYGKSKGSRVGDVYNLKTTGMNYAFVGPAQSIHVVDQPPTIDGYAIFEFAKLCSETPQQKMLLVGTTPAPKQCTFAATTDSTGHYLLYAYLSNSSDPKTYIALEHILNGNNYVETTSNVRYYKIDSESEMWDALGESQSLTLWEE